MFIGQKSLVEKVNNSTLDSFPRSLMLIGDKGCGKHTLCNYIADKLKLPIITLDDKINDEKVEEIMFNPFPTLYIINIDDMLLKTQNTILKLVEEPLKNTYIILISEDITKVLTTLLNRCKKWNFKRYSDYELLEFIEPDCPDRELCLELFSTPGQIKQYQYYPLRDIKNLCDDILGRIELVSLPNVLNISEKIAFKGEKEKYDLDIFMKIFKNELLLKLLENDNRKYINIYKASSNIEYILNNCINKQKVFDNFLLSIWEASRK